MKKTFVTKYWLLILLCGTGLSLVLNEIALQGGKSGGNNISKSITLESNLNSHKYFWDTYPYALLISLAICLLIIIVGSLASSGKSNSEQSTVALNGSHDNDHKTLFSIEGSINEQGFKNILKKRQYQYDNSRLNVISFDYFIDWDTLYNYKFNYEKSRSRIISYFDPITGIMKSQRMYFETHSEAKKMFSIIIGNALYDDSKWKVVYLDQDFFGSLAESTDGKRKLTVNIEKAHIYEFRKNEGLSRLEVTYM